MTTSIAPTVAPAKLMTAAEFTARYEQIHAELVKGIVMMPSGPWPKHGKTCWNVGHLLGNYLDAHDFGHLFSHGSWVRTGTDPDTVRGGDVCFFSYERLPRGEIPEALLPVVPNLVIDVRAPSEHWDEIFAKVGEYLKAGVLVVLVLDPATAAASAYRDDELPQIFHNGDALTLPDVLPGFSVAVERLFA